jgi:AcrR family transcriptional regulator
MTHQGEQSRGHPARRKEIVEAARSIAAELGWSSVTVRAIAARIGCSASAIYQYFRDKDAVLVALAAEGQAALAASLDVAVLHVHGPGKRMRAAVRAMWDFAMRHRELYAVMFGLNGMEAYRRCAATPSTVTQIAAELVAKRETGDDAGDLADSIAATAHGFICLALAGGFPGGGDRAHFLLDEVVDDIVRGLGRR